LKKEDYKLLELHKIVKNIKELQNTTKRLLNLLNQLKIDLERIGLLNQKKKKKKMITLLLNPKNLIELTYIFIN